MTESLSTLSPASKEVLAQLFLEGPTQADDLVDPRGRNELIMLGLATAAAGWSTLTAAGVERCLAEGYGAAKLEMAMKEAADAHSAEAQRDLLLRSMAAVLKRAGGEMTLSAAIVLKEDGVVIMQPDGQQNVRFKYCTTEEAKSAMTAALEAARVLEFERGQAELAAGGAP